MTRIFPAYAYGQGPVKGCWWPQTQKLPKFQRLESNLECDVVVVGGGFTGLNTALHLAENGVDVAVLEAQHIGWGASGRNGGFCCLGGGIVEDTSLDQRFGREGRRDYRLAEKKAIEHVEGLVERLGLKVDRHSNGETELAHRPRTMEELRKQAEAVVENYGVEPTIIEQADLETQGMTGPFFGGITTPLGFALNPQKFVLGLAEAARTAGAKLFEHAEAGRMQRQGSKWTITVGHHRVLAEKVVIATNGYTSETLRVLLAGRYMPVQSNVIVTRPLAVEEQVRQGWTTAQMAFDTRNLLHYFRLMPDGRFLFGMRGGLMASPKAQSRANDAIRKDFMQMFPAWSKVDITNSWSGMVCVARNKLPFVGELPNMKGVFSGLCFHGNGVAMGSYAGALLADLILENRASEIPSAMCSPLARFPFGRARRLIMPAVYAGYTLKDR